MAKMIGLANAGLDTTNSIKQAAEFGIVKTGQKLAGLLLTLAEVHGLGLEAAQGLVLTEGYYWDRDAKSRNLAERFLDRKSTRLNSSHVAISYAVFCLKKKKERKKRQKYNDHDI